MCLSPLMCLGMQCAVLTVYSVCVICINVKFPSWMDKVTFYSMTLLLEVKKEHMLACGAGLPAWGQ